MKVIKKGSIVTQDKNFFYYWTCPKFKLEVIKIDGRIAYFKYDIIMKNSNNIMQSTKSINIDYIKIDISETRKQKLLKINERI